MSDLATASDGTGGGNYATGGIVNSPGFEFRGESGPEVMFPSRGGYVLPAAGLVSRLDTSATPPSDPDDGSAGVPAQV